MSKPRIGDLIEIPTSKGLVYAQYTHHHPQFGGLLRVFDGFFENRPIDFSAVADGPDRFSIFFPLVAAIKRGIFSVVGHSEVAPHNRPFPLFRDGVADPKTKRVAVWWLWDGEKEWRIGELTPEQRGLPIRAVWNDTLLVERIEKGWTPNTDSE